MSETKPNPEPKPEFDKEAAARVISLDLMSAERYAAQRLLERAHKEFPLAQAKMPPDFKGTHHITLGPEGNLVLNIWWNGHVWPLKFSGSLEPPPRTTPNIKIYE